MINQLGNPICRRSGRRPYQPSSLDKDPLCAQTCCVFLWLASTTLRPAGRVHGPLLAHHAHHPTPRHAPPLPSSSPRLSSTTKLPPACPSSFRWLRAIAVRSYPVAQRQLACVAPGPFFFFLFRCRRARVFAVCHWQTTGGVSYQSRWRTRWAFTRRHPPSDRRSRCCTVQSVSWGGRWLTWSTITLHVQPCPVACPAASRAERGEALQSRLSACMQAPSRGGPSPVTSPPPGFEEESPSKHPGALSLTVAGTGTPWRSVAPAQWRHQPGGAL